MSVVVIVVNHPRFFIHVLVTSFDCHVGRRILAIPNRMEMAVLAAIDQNKVELRWWHGHGERRSSGNEPTAKFRNRRQWC
jgi:hypothetical protein